MQNKKTQARYALADFSDMANRLSRMIDYNTELLTTKSNKLKNLVEELNLGFIELFIPENISIKESLNKWQISLQENNFSKITKSDICNISYVYDVINNKNFICEKLISVLIRQIHYFWTDLDNFTYKINCFQDILSKLKTNRKIYLDWQDKPFIIIGQNLVKYFKNELINKKIEISDLYRNKKFDLQKDDLLSNLIEFEFLTASIQNLSTTSSEINDIYDKFKNFMGNSVKPKPRYYEERNSSRTLSKYRNKLLALMIICCEKLQLPKMKKDLIEFVLNNTTYGDPRIVKWQNFESDVEISAYKTFKIWLNERDIEFFFENLIDSDPHYRKNFWLGYAYKIEEAIFILGNDVQANRDNFDEISKFRKLLPEKFLRVGSKYRFDTNVFILKIGDIYVLEFSKVGNACYLYNKENYDKYISILLTQRNLMSLKTSELKIESVALRKISHFTNWQYQLSNFIKNYIR